MSVSPPGSVHQNIHVQIFVQLTLIEWRGAVKFGGFPHYEQPSNVLTFWFFSNTVYQTYIYEKVYTGWFSFK